MKLTPLFVAVLVIFPLFSEAQTLVTELKKKNHGVYQGKIPAYSFIQDTLTISVDESPIEIEVTHNTIEITIGRINKKGSYHILFKGKNYYVIDAFFDGDVFTERLILNEKTATITREGSLPQPSASLKKIKNRKK